jgi:hypothetical protein
LIQQLLAMHQDADAVALTRSLLRNVAEAHCLPATGAEHRQHTTAPHLVLQADVSYQLLLVWAEVHSSLKAWI